MTLTTLNSKKPNYVENHEIYVGTHTGFMKRISVASDNPHAHQNVKGTSKITVLEYGNDDHDEILVARENNVVQIYDSTGTFQNGQEFPDGPIVGVAQYGGKTIAGALSGKIVISGGDGVDWKELQAGDNMSKLRQCAVDRKLVATGGKERQNILKVFDLERMEKIFTAKNLPNDFLQLEVPVWDSDLGFIDASVIAACSRYGYLRLYDTRKQRRPVQKYSKEDQMSFSCLVARDNMVYAGTTMGALKAFDTRNFKNFLHTYKGFTGGLSNLSLDESGKFLVSACLDRYVRVHQTDSCVMMYQSYVKSKPTAVLIKTGRNLNTTDIGKDVVEPKEETVEAEGSDDEYNAIFEKMPTVSENETESKEIKDQKRKGNQTEKKSKKKRKV